MKRNYPKTRWLALLLMALSIAACKKCKEEDPVSPCNGKSALKADFRIYQVINHDFARDTIDVPTMMDTIFSGGGQGGGNFTFEAVGSYDSVKWKLGTDERIFTNTKFGLSFVNVQTDQDIEVRFIGYKKPDNACFPNDDGVDTLFKRFSIKQILGYSPLLGKFKLVEEGSTRPDTAFVCEFSFSTRPYVDAYYMSNFPKRNKALDSTTAGVGNYRAEVGNTIRVFGRNFLFNTTWGFGGLVPRRTFGWLNATRDTLRVEVDRYTTGENYARTRWIGIRQN